MAIRLGFFIILFYFVLFYKLLSKFYFYRTILRDILLIIMLFVCTDIV